MKLSLKIALIWRDSRDLIDFAYRADITLKEAERYNAELNKKTGRKKLPFSTLK